MKIAKRNFIPVSKEGNFFEVLDLALSKAGKKIKRISNTVINLANNLI